MDATAWSSECLHVDSANVLENDAPTRGLLRRENADFARLSGVNAIFAFAKLPLNWG